MTDRLEKELDLSIALPHLSCSRRIIAALAASAATVVANCSIGHMQQMYVYALACLAVSATGFPEYRSELPNLPIVDGKVWPGVGHDSRGGGGAQNAFGKVITS